jgi:hypothetical protein
MSEMVNSGETDKTDQPQVMDREAGKLGISGSMPRLAPPAVPPRIAAAG